LTGKILFKENIDNTQTINIGGLAKGIYIVRVTTDNKVITDKIIKQ
jgi:hypothetical protein